ncbi:ABC transporter permease [Rhodococcus rhodochrous]|uniref:ABC transmembrane type-1 domain-containing protein n=1 Tax=Rhodococcus rhodochrous KG-21 TaxID=1441923 RepID=A0A0M8PKU3_RHORH|nr:iron ABC transporter permease [Rhodococcus rhodochrous]KOS53728.1 hypothetical protein Z051_24000 [Rhodococcus rhodochrous KG-21]
MTLIADKPVTNPAPSTTEREWGRWLGRAGLATLIGLVLLVVAYPIIRLLLETFFPGWTFDVSSFGELFASRGIGSVLIDTVIYVAGTLVLTTLFGGFLAWAMERTDARIGRLAGIMPIIPLLVPPIGSVLGYLTLFSPSSGLVNIALRATLLPDLDDGPISVTNFPGLIFITAVNLAPISYLILSSALRNADASLEEAARISGASNVKTLLQVTIPTIRPAIVSSALMIGILAVGAFTYPFFIGSSSGITTAAVFVFRGFSSWPPQQDIAIALSVLLMIVVQIAVYAQRRFARSERRSVIAGKRGASAPLALGRWFWPVRIAIIGYLGAVLIPIISLVIGSLLPYRGASFSFENMSLRNYTEVLTSSVTQRALVNSFTFGAIAAFVAMAVATALVYSAMNSARTARWTDPVLYAPSAIPHTALAAAFLVSFAGPPFNLYGTAALLVIAYATIFLPQAAAAASSAVSQINTQLVEAAYISGASQIRVIRAIILPMLVSGLFAGWIIVFFMAVNEVTVSALLAGIGVPVVGQVSVEYFDTGRVAEVGAMSVIISLVASVVVLFTYRIVSRTAATRSM